MLISILTIVHVVVSLFLILAVLLQSGNADMGTAFGGSSSSVLGASGGNKFMTRLTSVAAGVFFVTSLSLAILGTGAAGGGGGVTSDIPEPVSAEKKAEGTDVAKEGEQATAPADTKAEGKKTEAAASEAAPKAPEAKASPKEEAKPAAPAKKDDAPAPVSPAQ